MPRNPAERVAGQEFRQWRDCPTCGEPVEGGTRGPLPRLHRDCVAPEQALLYQVRSAARLAHRIGRQSAGLELDALAATLLVGGRHVPPPPAAPAARFPGE